MSDRIIFRGQIYGNTIATPMAVVAKEEPTIDVDGVQYYIVQDPDDNDYVEIKNGGRVTYGTNDLEIIVCQGIKMTLNQEGVDSSNKYEASPHEVTTAFLKGFVKPTDLYTSFDLKIGWLNDPPGYNELNKQYVTEKFNLIVPTIFKKNNVDSFQFAFRSEDIKGVGSGSNPAYLFYNEDITIEGCKTIFKGYRSGASWQTKDFFNSFPATYQNSVTAANHSVDYKFSQPTGFATYAGIYFVVTGVISLDGDATAYAWKKQIKNSEGQWEDTLKGSIYGYYNEQNGNFYKDSSYTEESRIIPTSDKIYIAIDTDKTYQLSGSNNLVEFSWYDTEEEAKAHKPEDTQSKRYVEIFKTPIYAWDGSSYSNINTARGYLYVQPMFAALKACDINKRPNVYFYNYTAPTEVYSGTISTGDSLKTKDIISKKENGVRKFYVYNSSQGRFVDFTPSHITGTEINYYGDVVEVPETGGNITTAESRYDGDDIRTIFKQLLNVTDSQFYEDSSLRKSGDFQVIADNNKCTNLKIYSSNIPNTVGAIYTEEKDNNYQTYTLVAQAASSLVLKCPLFNKAEKDFALGMRERLDYISKDEYEKLVPNINEGEN